MPTTPNATFFPNNTGVGLRSEHYQDILATLPKVGWLEIHPENYFGEGGKPLYYLQKIREHYPISFHGVGLSLGSCDELNQHHLKKLAHLIDRFDPILISEHLSWSSFGGNYLHDLVPLPYTTETLDHLCARINQVQDLLQKQILLENISSYLEYEHSSYCESEFLTQIVRRTGCGILLDINNLYVNSKNHGWDVENYLANIPKDSVQEIHLAGFTENDYGDGTILIDTHNQPVAEPVWELYKRAITHLGRIPTLIEWDKDLPELAILLEEAKKADAILKGFNHAHTP